MSDGFSADWLALREPHDRAARAAAWPVFALPEQAARWRSQQAAASPLAMVDLACGSGSNFRALAPQIGGPQRWQLIDHDPALLAAVPAAVAAWAAQQGYAHDALQAAQEGPRGRVRGPGFDAEWQCRTLDLSREPGRVVFDGCRLVTASALLDLVSAHWLDALLGPACRAGAALLFALNVDGRTNWLPPDGDDYSVHQLFSSHQRRNKGFGPALGAAAAAHAGAHLERAGYRVQQVRTDWCIEGAAARGMLAAMVEGSARAAIEQQPEAAPRVQAWMARRLAGLASTRLTVGHLDVFAQPAQPT